LGEHLGGVEMGRLTKKKLDAIKKSRVDGYTQKETAQRVGVDIKTVKKYDPLRRERQEVSQERRIERLETICNSLAAELSSQTEEFEELRGAMWRILHEQAIDLEDYVHDVEESRCPKCRGDMMHDKSHFHCHQCGFSAPYLEDSL
jgi:transcriptional regulator with XRE-family HTH domain